VHFDNDWKEWVAPEEVRARKQFVLSTEFGTGLMTEEQILGFVQTKTKNNSITGLEKMEVIDELIETINVISSSSRRSRLSRRAGPLRSLDYS
jgi:hypothetical protein